MARSPRKSAKRRLEPEVEDDVDQGLAQPVLPHVVRTVGRRFGVDMLGGNGGADEKTTVVEVRALKDLARDRIEEGLRALLVVDQQRDVVALDVSPARIVDARAAEVLLQPDDRLGNTTVVKVDTVARDMADRKPVGGLEITLGPASRSP